MFIYIYIIMYNIHIYPLFEKNIGTIVEVFNTNR